jgi:hypothetical protein
MKSNKTNKMETQLKRIDRLQLSQQNKDTLVIQFQVQKDSLKLQSDILATEESIANQKIVIEELKNSKAFSPRDIINAKVELENLEDGVRRLKELQKEEF